MLFRSLRLEDRGSLASGALADLIVLPAGLPLSAASRADLRLVMLGGAARYGDSDYVCALGGAGECSEVHVDGRVKLLQSRLADSLASGATYEPGVTVPGTSGRAVCA